MQTIAAVRLEGGLGDHILGLRLLPFISRRYPNHHIIVYSDSGANRAQLDIVRLSPYVREVVPVFRILERVTKHNLWHLDNLRPQDIELMRSADVFFDAALWSFFVPQSKVLGVPFYDILASRPELRIPQNARSQARDLLGEPEGLKYIGLNLSKYGAQFIHNQRSALRAFLRSLMTGPATRVLNIFSRSTDFPHWPEPERSQRRKISREESEVISELSSWDERIIPIVDQPIAVVAALLEMCRYFVGVDNGIKHLAWALGISHTLILPHVSDFNRPENVHEITFVLHWIPDFDRTLALNCADQVAIHTREAIDRLNQS
jgi:hypothetical protein